MFENTISYQGLGIHNVLFSTWFDFPRSQLWFSMKGYPYVFPELFQFTNIHDCGDTDR